MKNINSIIMKATKIFTLIFVCALMVFVSACVNDDDYDLPNVSIQDPNIPADNITTFRAALERYIAAVDDNDNGEEDFDEIGTDIGIFLSEEDEELIYIEGYVVSTDQAGNFFEEILIQNKTDESTSNEDPRMGYRVSINIAGLNNTYELGRKVYIKLNGLAIGVSNGVYTIGKPDGTSIGQIGAFEYRDFVIRSTEVVEVSPKVAAISDLGDFDENTLIKLENTQFNRNQLGLTYAGEASDEFDGFRTLENCETNASIPLQTSTFADFKSLPIDNGRGSITGIYSRDFRDDFGVFIINSRADINFESEDRCDPIELDCGLANTAGTMNLFADDFESQTPFSLITGNGWTNYIEAGSEGWEAYTSGGTNSSLGVSARMSAYQSGDASNIGWLIMPEIDFDAQEGETLQFQTSNSFSDGSTMELLYSTDWDGTEAGIATATWGILPAAYIVQDGDFYGDWFTSGIVDLSCAEGTMHIAFKYVGSSIGDFTGTYELDEITLDYM